MQAVLTAPLHDAEAHLVDAAARSGARWTGQRHTALVSYAGRLRARGLTYDEALLLFEGRWRDCAQPPEAPDPFPFERARAVLADVYERYPAGAALPVAPRPASGPGDPAGQRRRRVRLTRAWDIPLRAVEWAWAGRVPAGAMTRIAGREGIGKSLVAVSLTAQLTRGTLPGKHHGTPRTVFYAAAEDSWMHTVAPRLKAAGTDLSRVFRVDVVEDEGVDTVFPLTLPRDCAALAARLREEQAAMLVIDPLTSVVDGKIDTHRNRELRGALEPLARLADETGCAVVGLAHHGKASTTDPLSLVLGSRRSPRWPERCSPRLATRSPTTGRACCPWRSRTWAGWTSRPCGTGSSR